LLLRRIARPLLGLGCHVGGGVRVGGGFLQAIDRCGCREWLAIDPDRDVGGQGQVDDTLGRASTSRRPAGPATIALA
jgi:hypothetical protein